MHTWAVKKDPLDLFKRVSQRVLHAASDRYLKEGTLKICERKAGAADMQRDLSRVK